MWSSGLYMLFCLHDFITKHIPVPPGVTSLTYLALLPICRLSSGHGRVLTQCGQRYDWLVTVTSCRMARYLSIASSLSIAMAAASRCPPPAALSLAPNRRPAGFDTPSRRLRVAMDRAEVDVPYWSRCWRNATRRTSRTARKQRAHRLAPSLVLTWRLVSTTADESRTVTEGPHSHHDRVSTVNVTIPMRIL